MTSTLQSKPAARSGGLLEEPFRQLPLALLWKSCFDVLTAHAEQDPQAAEWARQLEHNLLARFLESPLPFSISVVRKCPLGGIVAKDVGFAERLTNATRDIFLGDRRLQTPRLGELQTVFQEAFAAGCRLLTATSEKQEAAAEPRPIVPSFELAKKCVSAWFKQAEAILAWRRLDGEIARWRHPLEQPNWETLAVRCHEVHDRIDRYDRDRAWFSRDRKLGDLLRATQQVLAQSASAFDKLRADGHAVTPAAASDWRHCIQQIRQRANQVIESYSHTWMPATIAALMEYLASIAKGDSDAWSVTEDEWKAWRQHGENNDTSMRILTAHHLLSRLNAAELSRSQRDTVRDWCRGVLAPLTFDWPDAARLHVRLAAGPLPRGTIVKPLHLVGGDAPVEWEVSVGPGASSPLTAWLDLPPPPFSNERSREGGDRIFGLYQDFCESVLRGEQNVAEFATQLRALLSTEAGCAWFHQLVQLSVGDKSADAGAQERAPATAWYHALRGSGLPCYPFPSVDGSAAEWPTTERADLESLLTLKGVRWEGDSRRERFQCVDVARYAVSPELAECVLSLGKVSAGDPSEMSKEILTRIEALPLSPADSLCHAARRLCREAYHHHLDANYRVKDGAASDVLNAMLAWMQSKTGGNCDVGLAGKESFSHAAQLDTIRELLASCCKAWRRRAVPNLWQFARPLSQSSLGKPLDVLKKRAVFSAELPGTVLLRRFAVVDASVPGDDACDYAVSAGHRPKNYDEMCGVLRSAPPDCELVGAFQSFCGEWLDPAEREKVGHRLFSGYWQTRRHWLDACREDAERFDELLRDFLSAELNMAVKVPKGTEFREKSWVELESFKEERRIITVCRPALFTADGKCRVTAKVELD